MATKKKQSKSKNIKLPAKSLKNVSNQRQTSKADTEEVFETKLKKLMVKKIRSPILKGIRAHLNVSTILKEPGDVLQDDVEEDSFNPPLHSTVVDDDGDEIAQTIENPEQIPAKLMSPSQSAVQKKRRPILKGSNSQPAANMEHNADRRDTAQTKEVRGTPQKRMLPVPEPGSSNKRGTPQKRMLPVPEPGSSNKRGTPQKTVLPVPEPGSSKKHGTPQKTVLPVPEPGSSNKRGTPQKTASVKKRRSPRKEQNISGIKKSSKGNVETDSSDTYHVEIAPKSVRSVQELDVVLFESAQLIKLYKEKVETDACKKAVDVFFIHFKEQLSTTISDIQKLEVLKRKNAKMLSEIGKKRRRLFEVKNEILAAESENMELQEECSEMEKNQELQKSARTILDNIAHLQEDYKTFKAENPHSKETYGMSSLPALSLEAENILKAEQHFHIVNKQLQSFIDEDKEDG
ncbi:nucleic acid-templated transcription [Pristimantis euphronides]